MLPTRSSSLCVAPAVGLLVILGCSGDPAQSASRGSLTRVSERAWTWISPDQRSSNGAVLSGTDAALVVDPGLTALLARELIDAAREATGKPVRHVVTTHWHPDHALGVACLQDDGFEIVAHPKTRRRVAEQGARTARGLVGDAPSPEEAEAFRRCRIRLAERIVDDRVTVDLGDHVIEIFHPGAAHTAGDLVVWSAEEKFLAAGDLFMHDASPSMGEASAFVWADVLDELTGLEPVHVVAGHFGPSVPSDLARFKDYVRALVERVEEELAGGTAPESVPQRVRFPAFADFGQYPQFGATFAGNAGAVAQEVQARAPERGVAPGFEILSVLDVGLNPHQISFSGDGSTAFVASAGSDRVTLVDVAAREVSGEVAVEGTPLGVVVLPGGDELGVTRFRGGEVARYSVGGGEARAVLKTGMGASLIYGPLPDGDFMVSVEQEDKLLVLDPGTFTVRRSFETGDRPFPSAATSDGRLAFVPGYDDGTVTVVDLWNRRVLERVQVGELPSGGVVLPGDIDYAVAVRGENRVAFINTASHQVVGSLSEGIGESPFSVVTSPSGRLAFVNNTASHDISVIALPERRVIGRIAVGEIPIVIAVHPSGETLWVSSEGSHTLSIIQIPEQLQSAPPEPASSSAVTEVSVMGMIHGRHPDSEVWGLEQVSETIRNFRPDALCTEISPDRWERIWSDFTERGVIEDPRVLRFPEYTDAILDLAVEMGFEIVPCAGWTVEMSDLRNARIEEFNTEDRWKEKREQYERLRAEVTAANGGPYGANDDPRFIHSDAYDESARAELRLYDEYQNDLIGPGGWTNINQAHFRNIDKAIRRFGGSRVLITFGAGHKYWFLDQLKTRADVALLDLRDYLR